MDEFVKMILDELNEQMDKTIDHFKNELVKIRAGRANPSMLNGITVEYYGSQTPLSQVSTISTMDARTLTVKPWEKNMLHVIEKALLEANLGITPQNNGEMILLPIPMLTEERRRDLVKQAKGVGEDAKIALRNERRSAISELKKLKDENVSEDAIKNGEAEVEKIIKSHEEKVNEILKVKEEEIMTV